MTLLGEVWIRAGRIVVFEPVEGGLKTLWTITPGPSYTWRWEDEEQLARDATYARLCPEEWV